MKLIEKTIEVLATHFVHDPLTDLSLPNALDEEIDLADDELEEQQHNGHACLSPRQSRTTH